MKKAMKKAVSLTLVLLFVVPLLNMPIKVNAATKTESFGIDRYTVLVLDASGKHTFHPSGGGEYIADSSINEVKQAASVFLNDVKRSVGKNYVAIVSFSKDATLVSDFTDNFDTLERSLAGINDSHSVSNVTSGLEMANQLFQKIDNDRAIKNVLLCTTGLVNYGEYAYSGKYDSNTIASTWFNESTNIKLYAYANCAITAADQLKNNDTMIYVIGIHTPIESALPSSAQDLAQFFRMTARDLASSQNTYHLVEDTGQLEFVFGELQEDLTGTVKKRIYNDAKAYRDDVPKEYPDGKLGGYYEDMVWGDYLFEMPATKMLQQSITSTDSANYNLAMVSGNLCITSYSHEYLKQAYHDLGFDDENIYFYSYPESDLNRKDAKRGESTFATDGDLAFSIASKPIIIDGKSADLLIITLRGTQNPKEIIKDRTNWADKEFYEYTAWDWPYEFEEDVFAGLEDYHKDHPDLGNKPLKILVTGHSLGGAGANLVAAKLNKEVNNDNWYAKNTGLDDIYAYTFGAIDSIITPLTRSMFGPVFDGFDWIFNGETKKKEAAKFPIEDGYENIINIYNYLDAYGLLGDGSMGLGLNGYGATARGNTILGKFGVLNTYSNDMKDVINPREIIHPTHEIVGYVHALKSGWVENGVKTDKKRICIRCPVDVEVYSGDNLLCKIASDKIEKKSDDIPVTVEDSGKVLLLPTDGDYRVVITATDSGTMAYTAESTDNANPTAIGYQDVALKKGKRMLSEINKNTDVDKTELFVVDENNNKLFQIATDGKETEVKKPINSLLIIVPIIVVAFMMIVAVFLLFIKKRKVKAGIDTADSNKMYQWMKQRASSSSASAPSKRRKVLPSVKSADNSQKARPLFCPKCGAQLKEGALYCQQCGSRVDSRKAKQ